jgi:hypothetical protein
MNNQEQVIGLYNKATTVMNTNKGILNLEFLQGRGKIKVRVLDASYKAEDLQKNIAPIVTFWEDAEVLTTFNLFEVKDVS